MQEGSKMKTFSTVLMTIVLAVICQSTAWGTDYSDYVIGRSDVIAYYKLDGKPTLPTVPDYSTNGYDAAQNNIIYREIAGPRTTDGWAGFGTANTHYDFRGGGDISLGTDARTETDLTNMTFAAMVRMDGNSVIYEGGTGNTNPLQIQHWNSGGYRVFIKFGDGKARGFGPNALIDNLWHHLVVTRDGTNVLTDVAVYVDGVALSQTAYGDGTMSTVAASRIGARGDGSQRADGGIDEVAFFDTALSEAEVWTLYRVARPTTSYDYANHVMDNSKLIAYYQFEEQSGTVVTNVAGNSSFNGTTDIPLPGDSTNGPTASDGFSGMGTANKAFAFGATASTEVTLPSGLELATDRTNLTISAMVKMNSVNNSSHILELSRDQANSILIQHWNNGGNKLFIKLNGGAGEQFGAAGPLNDLQWHHLVVVRNGTAASSAVSVYLDGEALSKMGAVSNGGQFAGVSAIGAAAGNNGRHFNGKIDDVAFFSYAMTAEEVEEMYLIAAPPQGTVIVIK